MPRRRLPPCPDRELDPRPDSPLVTRVRLHAVLTLAAIGSGTHRPAMSFVRHPLALVRALSLDRTRLALQNVLLRQQLNVLRRNAKRPKLEDSDR